MKRILIDYAGIFRRLHQSLKLQKVLERKIEFKNLMGSMLNIDTRRFSEGDLTKRVLFDFTKKTQILKLWFFFYNYETSNQISKRLWEKQNDIY